MEIKRLFEIRILLLAAIRISLLLKEYNMYIRFDIKITVFSKNSDFFLKKGYNNTKNEKSDINEPI